MPRRRDELAKLVESSTSNSAPRLTAGPSTLDLFDKTSKSKRSTLLHQRPVAFLPYGRTLVEAPGTHRAPKTISPQEPHSPPPTHENDETYTFYGPSFSSPRRAPLDPTLSRFQRKQLRQHQRWTEEVIPLLVDPYLDLLRRSGNLRTPASPVELPGCNCRCMHTSLDVVCMSFTGLSRKTLEVCLCRKAPGLLLGMGYFGCAPCFPTFAVDLNVLDFCMELFFRIAPNHTAICSTLEAFLQKRGFVLASTDSLRKRFSKCFLWFSALRNKVESHVEMTITSGSPSHVECAESEIINGDYSSSMPSSPCPRNNLPLHGNFYNGVGTDTIDSPLRDAEADEVQGIIGMSAARRPSPYLQGRCPACFGAPEWIHDPSETADFMVCIDACFQQKRGKTGKGVPLVHSKTVFLPQEDVDFMQAEVESLRCVPPKRRRDGSIVVSNVLRDAQKVADEVLDGCEASFKAADERRQKASTNFFEDTGLMALLCRHDRVLWLVNMQSAGEKQHYALALLRALLQNIPSDAMVGILYDIGCQLHRSIIKWGFLAQFVERMNFAISVFHAYGHQWACQIVYHPRKCEGFGLTDGEGCERFWSSIRHLVANLRIATSYQRHLLLDYQVEHLSNTSLFKLGFWLYKRNKDCYERLSSATDGLNELHIPHEVLVAQWSAQVDYQSKSLPRQSKNAGKSLVEEVVSLRTRRDAISRRIAALNKRLALGEDDDVESVTMSLKDLESAHSRVCDVINEKTARLGVSDRAKLSSHQTVTFINDRMNARALRMRLLAKLQSRRFELSNLERPYQSSKSSYSDHKKSELVESQLKRREPGVMQLAKSYNLLCKKIRRRAPRHAACPKPIDLEGLFELDVDSDIWLDESLFEAEEQEVPRWLGDDDVRKGIRLYLEVQRCREELRRIGKEKLALKGWFRRVWDLTIAASSSTEPTSGLAYAIDERRQRLLDLCIEWDARLQTVSPRDIYSREQWGPTAEELADYRERRDSITYQTEPAVRVQLQFGSDGGSDGEEDLSDDGEVEVEEQIELYELAEQVENDFIGQHSESHLQVDTEEIISFVSPSKRLL